MQHYVLVGYALRVLLLIYRKFTKNKRDLRRIKKKLLQKYI